MAAALAASGHGDYHDRNISARTQKWISARSIGPTSAGADSGSARKMLRCDEVHDALEPDAVGLGEIVRLVAVDVEDQPGPAVCDKGYDDLGLRERAAGDVAGERVNVGNDDGLAPARRRAAYALAEGDRHAGERTLERAERQHVGRGGAVEADPMEAERFLEDGSDIGEVGDQIVHARHHRLDLRQQGGVDLRARGPFGNVQSLAQTRRPSRNEKRPHDACGLFYRKTRSQPVMKSEVARPVRWWPPVTSITRSAPA